MATVKLEHVALLEDAKSFPEWKRAMVQVLRAKGYWGHVEGTENKFDWFPASHSPETPTAESKDEVVKAYQEWWLKDSRAQSLLLRRIAPVTYSHLTLSEGVTVRKIWPQIHKMYSRIDIMAQFDLKEKIQNLKLKDHLDFDRYLGEFRVARDRFIMMKVVYAKDNMVHQIIQGLPTTGSWNYF
jgi:hypothetical protein